MKAVAKTAYGPFHLEYTDVPNPVCGDNDIVLKVKAAGICGSDMHFYTHGSIGKKVAPFPFILGHECSGYVAELGEGVASLKVGDRVALNAPEDAAGPLVSASGLEIG